VILLATILDTVQRFVHAGGYYVIFALLFACGLGLPLPEDIPLILGGYFAAIGELHLGIVAFVAWFGIIGGDCVLYHMGKKYGLNITKAPLIGKHVTQEGIEKAQKLFEKYGIWVVGVGRMFAGIRGAMVLAAGTIRYNFIKFLIADGIGAIASGGLFLMLGYWAGKKLGNLNKLRAKIQHVEHWILLGLIVVVVISIGVYIYRRKRHKPSLGHQALTKVAEKAAAHQKHGSHPAPVTSDVDR
jgi:membrane protein DedA with SNARE-associated domain